MGLTNCDTFALVLLHFESDLPFFLVILPLLQETFGPRPQGYHNLMAEACQQLGVDFSELGTYEEVRLRAGGPIGRFFRSKRCRTLIIDDL